jgi:hypothetical protein
MLNFDYATSVLNPTLKIVIAVIFLGGVYFYYKTSKEYEGALNHNVLVILLWASVCGFIAAFTRYFDHGLMFGFTKEYSLKWFQSIFSVIQSFLFAVGGYILFKSVKK